MKKPTTKKHLYRKINTDFWIGLVVGIVFSSLTLVAYYQNSPSPKLIPVNDMSNERLECLSDCTDQSLECETPCQIDPNNINMDCHRQCMAEAKACKAKCPTE